MQLLKNSVNHKLDICVSNVKMSPITAELKCPYETRKDIIGSEEAPLPQEQGRGGHRLYD
jgi:hypothetical protein